MATPRTYEQRAWKRDHIRVVLLTDNKMRIGRYYWDRALPDNKTVADFIRIRIRPVVEGKCEFAIFDGTGQPPNGHRKLGTLRASYQHQHSRG